MKHNILSFTAAVLAIVFSAFANVRLKDTKHFYHVGNVFVETVPPGLSCQDDDYCCELIYSGINLPSGSFAENQIPQSEDYAITRMLENASYQD